jgi:hypothetical protein
MAQDSPAEEQQQSKDQYIEDKANEEYTPLSDVEDEKMYRDADEVDSFGIAYFIFRIRGHDLWVEECRHHVPTRHKLHLESEPSGSLKNLA